MKNTVLGILAITSVFLTSMVSSTETVERDCAQGMDITSMHRGELVEIYECYRPEMLGMYQTQSNPVAMDYEQWLSITEAPYQSEPKSRDFHMIYVNDIGYESYGSFEEYGLLEGTVVVRENLTMDDSGNLNAHELYVLRRLEDDPDTDEPVWETAKVTQEGDYVIVSHQEICDNLEREHIQDCFLVPPYELWVN